jgi:hypothetical protein
VSTTAIETVARPEQVFDVLLDPYAYPRWVVGARRIRAVDETWPSEHSAFHHTVGFWPVLVDDHTRLLACERRSRLKLRARAWPFGEADVTITLERRGERTLVTMREEPVAGPARDVWNRFTDVVGHVRNSISLIRLKGLAESRSGPSAPSEPAS